jgi:hypothetical protein
MTEKNVETEKQGKKMKLDGQWIAIFFFIFRPRPVIPALPAVVARIKCFHLEMKHLISMAIIE